MFAQESITPFNQFVHSICGVIESITKGCRIKGQDAETQNTIISISQHFKWLKATQCKGSQQCLYVTDESHLVDITGVVLFRTHFSESPAKCFFLPCFHALKLLGVHLVVATVFFGTYFLLRLFSRSSPIKSNLSTSFLFNFNDLCFFSAGSMFSFLWSESLLLAVQSPIPK